MAVIRPFQCMRPAPDKAEHIAALPYDVVSREEAASEIAREPLSFLRIDRAETNFDPAVGPYETKVYQKAASLLKEGLDNGDFITDPERSFYLYELTMEGRIQTGIVCVASAEDYRNGIIKKHENTLESKEEDRVRHVDTCSAQTGPIFLGYRANDAVRALCDGAKKAGNVLYDFVSPDGIRHRVFSIADEDTMQKIEERFAGNVPLYICDGHHRCASAVRVSEKRRSENPHHTGEEEYNFFLAVLFPDDELKIYDYNRVVKDLNGLSEDRFLDRVRKKFIVEKVGRGPFRPEKKGRFGMYVGGAWYALTIKEGLIAKDLIEELDVSILQNELLAPILNIEDPKRDERISFVGGIRGLEALSALVDSGKWELAFSMYPTGIDELFAVADAGYLMPPKSTWFEPKLRSGLFIHRI